MIRQFSTLLPTGLLVILASTTPQADEREKVVEPKSGWRQHEMNRPRPPEVRPESTTVAIPPPRDAIILFDGNELGAWQTPEGRPAAWKVENGVLEVSPGAGPIQTRQSFGDIQLHVEWASPAPPVGKGQDRGNSGIFLMGRFELQVLDSYNARTYADGQAGAIYGQYPPLFNASRPPGEWQIYEIAFRHPRFDAKGNLEEPARITVIHNGILIQNNEEPWGQTNWLEAAPYEPGITQGPIQLQDHGHPVRFRNIWLRKLPTRSAPVASELRRPEIITLPDKYLASLEGEYQQGHGPSASKLTISREEGHLLVRLPFRPRPVRALPISRMVFVLPYTDAELTFQSSKEGVIDGVRMRVGDGDRTLRKIQ
jgi:hypothetical protein